MLEFLGPVLIGDTNSHQILRGERLPIGWADQSLTPQKALHSHPETQKLVCRQSPNLATEMSLRSKSHPFWSPLRLRDRRMQLAYAAVVLLAAGVRAILHIATNDLAAPNLWEFDDIAINLLDTGVFSWKVPGVPSAYMPPAFPLVIAASYSVFGVGLTAHAVLASILWCLELYICFLIGSLGERIWNSRVGWLAFVLALYWPGLLILSGRLHSIAIYLSLLLVALKLLLSRDLSPLRRAVLAGATMGAFGLFRFEAILLLAPFAYYLAFHSKGVRPLVIADWGRKALLIAALAITFILPLTPWIIRNALVFGQPKLSTVGGYAFLRGHHENASGAGRDPWPSNRGTPVPTAPEIDRLEFTDPLDEVYRDNWYRAYAVDYIKHHPRHELFLVAKKAFYFLVADFTHPYARLIPVWLPSLIALLIGFHHWVKTGLHVPEQQILWMLFGLQCSLAIVLFVLPRYRFLVDFVPLLLFAAWLNTGKTGLLLSARVWRGEDKMHEAFPAQSSRD